LILADCKDADA